MSVNYRVSTQVNKLLEARGTDRYLAEKEKYWQILEEELTANPKNCWIGYENPTDYLDGLLQSFGTEFCTLDKLNEAFADYKRFHDIYERATGRNRRDQDIIDDAEAALELLAC